MAYKFQLGDFAASGSILMEGKGTTTDDLIARADVYATGSVHIAQAKKLVLDTDKDTFIYAAADDDMQLAAQGRVGVRIRAGDVQLGDGANQALTLNAEGADSSLMLKDNSAAPFEIKEAGNSYLKFATTHGSEAIAAGVAMTGTSFSGSGVLSGPSLVVEQIGRSGDVDLMQLAANQVLVNGSLSASANLVAGHGMARQLTIGYDGSAGSEGHLKLGAGGDMQLAVFSDNAMIMNNTVSKDIQFQVKTAGGDNIQPLKIVASAVTHHVDIAKMALSGTVVNATAAELNKLAGSTSDSAANKMIILDANGDFEMQDSDKIFFGTGADASIHWDGSTFKIGTDTSGAPITLGHSTSEVTIADNLVVAGDLTVQGDTVQVDVAKLSVEDPLIELARGQGTSADALDIGFFGKYGVGGTAKYAGLFRDQNDSGKFHLFKDSEEDLTAVTTINRGASGYAKATLVVAALEADTITGAVGKTIVSKNDTQLDNGGAGFQLASGDCLIASQDLGASRKVFLPAAPVEGDVVEVKLKGIGAAGRVLAIEKGHDSQNVDGGDSIILESDYAAVTLVASTAGNSCAWRVF